MEETKKQKTSIKKILGAFLALVLVAVISVVGTLAYLKYKTAPIQNTFTGSDDISLSVLEPNWNTTGKDLAKSYTPNLIIPKDPKLQNTTTNAAYSEWVAIRVDYYKGSTPTAYSTFAKSSADDSSTEALIEPIAFNTTDWIDVSPSGETYQVYIYNKPLANNTSTPTLFDQVQINKNLTKSNGDTTYPAFNIYITGAAIKVESSHSGITELTADSMSSSGEPQNIKNALLSELAGVTITP